METITRQQTTPDPAARGAGDPGPARGPRPPTPHGPAPRRGVAEQPQAAQRRVPGFAILAALQSLDELHGEGPHTVGDVARAAQMSTDATCRLLRLAERDKLVVRPRMGSYVLSSTHAAALSPLDNPDLFESHPVLAELQAAAGVPALLFATTYIPGAPPRRILLSHELGEDRASVTGAALQQQEALMQAPLDLDPAGQVILAFLHVGQSGRPDLRAIRDQSLACGPSPVRGLDMLAAPVWRGAEVAGAIALLMPDITSERDRRALTYELAASAVATSRQTTAAATRSFRFLKAS